MLLLQLHVTIRYKVNKTTEGEDDNVIPLCEGEYYRPEP